MNIPCDFVAKIISIEGEFLGTGFLVGSEYVVTCLHVLKREKEISVRASCSVVFSLEGVDGGSQTVLGVTDAVSDGYDLVLIRLSGTTGRIPVRLLRGFTSSHEPWLAGAEWTAVGHSDRDAAFFDRKSIIKPVPHFTADQKTGTLLSAQVHQGLENGFSGGPLLVRDDKEWYCIGLIFLGGEHSGTSRMLMADCLLGFLAQKVPDLKSRGADEFFKNYPYVHRRPDKIPPKLAALLDRTPTGEISRRSRWTITLAVVLFFITLAAFAEILWTPSPDSTLTKDKPLPVPPAPKVLPPKLYGVQVAVYSGNERPRFSINGKSASPAEYNSGIAKFLLAAGAYHIRADYAERVCEADVSISSDSNVGAGCHLK